MKIGGRKWLMSIPKLVKHLHGSGQTSGDELAKLAQLRDAGVLTEEEFAAQKARLLA